MMRSKVDLPHPDGPITETNSPRSISRSMSCRAMVCCPEARKTLLTSWSDTTGTRCAMLRFPTMPPLLQHDMLAERDGQEKEATHERGDHDGGPQFGGAGNIILVEIEDGAAEPIAHARGQFADDSTDDA